MDSKENSFHLIYCLVLYQVAEGAFFSAQKSDPSVTWSKTFACEKKNFGAKNCVQKNLYEKNLPAIFDLEDVFQDEDFFQDVGNSQDVFQDEDFFQDVGNSQDVFQDKDVFQDFCISQDVITSSSLSLSCLMIMMMRK